MPNRPSPAAHPLLAHYEMLVASGAIERDEAQIALLRKLETLAKKLAEHQFPSGKGRESLPSMERDEPRSGSGWGEKIIPGILSLPTRRSSTADLPTRGRYSPDRQDRATNSARALAERALSLFSPRPKAQKPPRGLYVWGKVGRGKTTLMNLFFDHLDVERKRRVHFHAFMADVHERLHRVRRAALQDGDKSDPVLRVAEDLAQEMRALCFDEFAVADIADATILSRLFGVLFERGVVVVATSNVEPQRLYEGGRNRELFLPFIALIEERMEIVRLDARTDFRLEKLSLDDAYHAPHGEKSRRAIDALFRKLTGVARGEPTAIEIKSRRIEIPQAARRVARFEFADLCSRPLGASDYIEIARNFDTIIVEGVPTMGFDRRNEAKRFITLVDVLYERKVKLVLSAEAEAHRLYSASHGHEALEFRRTVSRLMEMRSEAYLESA